MGDELICGYPNCLADMFSDMSGQTSYYEEDSDGGFSLGSFSWTALIDPIADLGGSVFDFLGTKDDVELSELELEKLRLMGEGQEDIQRQRTKTYLIIGGILLFLLTIVAFIVIAKKNK